MAISAVALGAGAAGQRFGCQLFLRVSRKVHSPSSSLSVPIRLEEPVAESLIPEHVPTSSIRILVASYRLPPWWRSGALPASLLCKTTHTTQWLPELRCPLDLHVGKPNAVETTPPPSTTPDHDVCTLKRAGSSPLPPLINTVPVSGLGSELVVLGEA